MRCRAGGDGATTSRIDDDDDDGGSYEQKYTERNECGITDVELAMCAGNGQVEAREFSFSACDRGALACVGVSMR